MRKQDNHRDHDQYTHSLFYKKYINLLGLLFYRHHRLFSTGLAAPAGHQTVGERKPDFNPIAPVFSVDSASLMAAI